jgi:succinate dehydrogenase / fumarate reductase, membrane anchor subunit
MVTAVTNFGRSGLADWLAQRLSAVVLLAYFICLGSFLVANPGVGYEQWHGLFQHTAMRVFSMLALLSLGAHGWIGMWAVSTDYLTERQLGPKGNVLRGLFQLVCGLVVFTYLVWGIEILWG